MNNMDVPDFDALQFQFPGSSMEPLFDNRLYISSLSLSLPLHLLAVGLRADQRPLAGLQDASDGQPPSSNGPGPISQVLPW